MSDTTEPIDPVNATTGEPATTAGATVAAPGNTVPTETTAAPSPAPVRTPITRRTVTLPLLPLAIVAAVIVALLFFGGGIAAGLAIGGHGDRMSRLEPFRYGPGQHLGGGAPNGNVFPGQRRTGGPVAPSNG